MPRSVAIHNAHPRLRLDRRAVAKAIGVLDAHAAKFRGGCPPGELSLVFLTDAALAKIHADFMDDPTATDVITFEGDQTTVPSDLSAIASRATAEALAKESVLAGEICVSADTAARFVGLPLAGPSRSTAGKTARRQAPALPLVEGPRLPAIALARVGPRGPRLAGTRALQHSFSTELTLYLLHGWLHLAGYDDLQPAKKRVMRAAEKRALTLLRAARAVPSFRLV